MLKSPVMISSEGKGTKNSRRFWNSSKKGRDFRRWKTIDIKKDSFFVARSKFSCHKFKRDRRKESFEHGMI